MLKPVTIKNVEPCPNPRFSKVQLVTAERDGQEFKWEISPGHDTVHIMVYNSSSQNLIYVKQVRIPVLVADPNTKGEVIECCAGLVDKSKPIEQIATEEVEEELGYKVRQGNLMHFKTVKSSVGKAGINSHLYLAGVTDEDKVSDGGGLENEDIEIVEVSVPEAMELMVRGTTDAVTIALTLMTLNTIIANEG